MRRGVVGASGWSDALAWPSHSDRALASRRFAHRVLFRQNTCEMNETLALVRPAMYVVPSAVGVGCA
jgi:hypothetical protein